MSQLGGARAHSSHELPSLKEKSSKVLNKKQTKKKKQKQEQKKDNNAGVQGQAAC